MSVPFLTGDVGYAFEEPAPQAICEQLHYSPAFPNWAWPNLSVSIDGPVYILIIVTPKPYVMNQAERDAMDRAFWRSVEVVDEGYSD